MTTSQLTSVTVDLQIENVYPDLATTTHLDGVHVRPPSTLAGEALDDWGAEELFPLTGTGRDGGDSAYEVSITGSSDPSLVGLSFNFG